MAYSGNASKVRADIELIAGRLQTTATTLDDIRSEYKVCIDTLRRELRAHLTRAGYDRLMHKRRKTLPHPGKFKKGHQGYRPPKCTHHSPRTEFKKGNVPKNHRPIGSIAIHRDKSDKKFRWIKVKEQGKQSEKYIPYARWVWMQKHGPVPKGKMVIHFDGDTLNDAIENLRAVTRAEHLQIQMDRDPRMVKRLRASQSRAAKKRHAEYRKQHGNAQIRLSVERETKKIRAEKKPDKMIAQLPRRGRLTYECNGCSANFEKSTIPCPKCGHLSFSEVRIAVAVAV